MNFARVIGFGLVLAGAAALAAAPARADTVTVSYSFSLNGAAIDVGSGVGTANYSGAFAGTNFFSTSTGGNASPFAVLPDLLNSSTNSLDVTSTGAGTIYIWVTDSDISSPISGTFPFISTLTSNKLSGGATVEMATYLDTNNGIANANLLTDLVLGAPQLFTTGPVTAVDQTDATVGSGPYSIIAMYKIVANAQGAGANATIDVSVPGPIVGAGLPGLLAACGGLMALARRRRRQVA